MTYDKLYSLKYSEKVDALTHDMRVKIADILIQETLPYANEICTPVCPKNTLYTRYVKRFLDIVLSGLALVVTLPINLILAIGTLCDVGRPIIFRQRRIGKNNKPFVLFKFRNMTNECDVDGNLLPASQRVTKFGRFVRSSSLDEFLNFWHVFIGDMSIIGPRPLVGEYLPRYSNRHACRTVVKPGLECPMRKDFDQAVTYKEQFENDIWYIENCSFGVDAMLFWKLLLLTFNRKECKRRGGARRGCFIGYDSNGEAISINEIDESYLDAVLIREVERCA